MPADSRTTSRRPRAGRPAAPPKGFRPNVRKRPPPPGKGQQILTALTSALPAKAKSPGRGGKGLAILGAGAGVAAALRNRGKLPGPLGRKAEPAGGAPAGDAVVTTVPDPQHQQTNGPAGTQPGSAAN